MSVFDLDPQSGENVMDMARANPLPHDAIGADWYSGIGAGLSQGLQSVYQRQRLDTAIAGLSSDDPTRHAEAQSMYDDSIAKLRALTPDPHTVGAIGRTLAVVHAAAAIKHQVVDRDGTLGRMIPFLR